MRGSHAFWTLILLALVPLAWASSGEQEATAPIQIGFDCCSLFNLDLGTPVFATGEELWVKANLELNVRLSAPNGSRVATRTYDAQSAALLHTFGPGDEAGEWRLEAITPQGAQSFSLEFVRPQVEGSFSNVAFALESPNFRMSGAFETGTTHEGGVILLRRLDDATAIETSAGEFRFGELRARIGWEQTDPFTLYIAPYVPEMVGTNGTRAWAQAWTELPFAKRVGNNVLVTYQPVLVAESFWFPLNITASPSQSFELRLPELHAVGIGGDAPLREGKLTIRVHVELETVTYTSQTEAFVTDSGLLASIASVTEVPPLLNPATFELSDSLPNLSRYQLVFFGKRNGVDLVHERNIVPPIVRFRVVNRMDGQPLTDYEIQSRTFQAVARAGGDTFVVTSDLNEEVLVSLSVGKVVLNSGEFGPNPVRLIPVSPITLLANAGHVQLKLSDRFGTIPQTGTIKVTRVFGGLTQPAFESDWSTATGLLNFTLPVGDYIIEFTVEGNTITRRVSVNEAMLSIDVQLGELILTESRNGLIFGAIAGAIALIEILVVLRVWRQYLKRRNPPLDSIPSPGTR